MGWLVSGYPFSKQTRINIDPDDQKNLDISQSGIRCMLSGLDLYRTDISCATYYVDTHRTYLYDLDDLDEICYMIYIVICPICENVSSLHPLTCCAHSRFEGNSVTWHYSKA